MKKNMDLLEVTLIVLCALLIIFTGLTALFNKPLFYVEAAVTVLAAAFTVWRIFHSQKDARDFLSFIEKRLGAVEDDTLLKFPMPVAVIDKNHVIIWSNKVFHERVMKGSDCFGEKAEDLFVGFALEKAFLPDGNDVLIRSGNYLINASGSAELPEPLYALYFIDRTEEKRVTKLYNESRPAVLSIALDNLEDLFANSKESEKSRIMGDIENLFEDFATSTHALIKRCGTSRYIAILEEQYLQNMEEERFSLLDKARKILTAEEQPVTLSIGVARGDYSLDRLLEFSAQALEMALGRGGDQAAVKTLNGYEFYGGFAKGVEKRTKVKTRVVAAALCDLIGSSSNVLVMGHRFGDLDCVGAGIAMAEACRDLGKEAFVVVNRETCLAKPLLDKTEKSGNLGLFLSPEEAKAEINENTLLIVVDTHVRAILESQEIYSLCRNVAVIDHHRRMLGNIDNAMIFYHEPYASSASEMVTELLQYFDSRCKIAKAEAEALLAGIMLDTKSFSMRAGVRTFEAAAYLRKQGADTVKVKMLFSGSLESYQHRSKIVSQAEIYRGCAVSAAAPSEDIALVAPQAADELLTIEGVAASVVYFETPTGVSFSARSLGTMNVQVIMETLGGGGHQTMAGAQVKDMTEKEAKEALLRAIDDYYDKAEGHVDPAPGKEL